jgi:hypothetical protein
MQDDEMLRQEFALMTARAGLTIPPDRVQVMFEAFVALRDLLAHVHRPYAYAVEPAFIGGGASA